MDHGWSGVPTKSESAHEHLKQLVIEGRLRPSRRLSPTDLAALLQISVTPVRDALVRLEAEGFVAGEPGRGHFSKPFTVEEQRDLQRQLFTSFLTCLDEVARDQGPAVRAALSAWRDAVAGLPEADTALAFVAAYDRLLIGLADRATSAIQPRLVRNAVERTRYVRRLDARQAGRRAAVAAGIDAVGARALEGDLMGAIEVLRGQARALGVELPHLVAEANAQISSLRFP